MYVCVHSLQLHFFSVTSTIPNGVYEKKSVPSPFPTGFTFSIASFLACFFLLIPQCSFTFIPALCKHASVLQRGILKVSQYYKAGHLVTDDALNFASRLPHEAPSKGIICSLPGNPVWSNERNTEKQEKISFYPKWWYPKRCKKNLFSTEKWCKLQHNSLAELQSTWSPVSSFVAITTRSHPLSSN